MKDRDLSEESGRFVAESELVVRRLLESRLVVHSVLATAPRLAALGAALGPPPRCPIYLASQAVLDVVTGFHVHRGCLAIGERPVAGTPAASLPHDARTIVILEDLVSADNIGACARNAAAFGADALVFSPRAADPFYRKAVRVSIGAVFQLPIVRCTAWPGDLTALKAAGFAIYGAVVDARATALPDVRRAAETEGCAASRVGRPGALAGRARRVRSPGDDSDVARRRLSQRRDRRGGGALSSAAADSLSGETCLRITAVHDASVGAAGGARRPRRPAPTAVHRRPPRAY